MSSLHKPLKPLGLKPYKNQTPILRCTFCNMTAPPDTAIGDQHESHHAFHGQFELHYDGDSVHFERTGNCVCSVCRHRYGRHPMAFGSAAQGSDGQPWLHVLCDGSLVKL